MNYASLFADAASAGVYHLPQGQRAELEDGAAAAGCLVVHIDLTGIRDKDGLLSSVGAALRFPEWFGHNWDALSDCLLDLGWLPAEGYVVVLDHCDGVHARAEADFVTLMEIFAGAAEEWREQGVPFWCLVDMLADGIAWLPTLE